MAYNRFLVDRAIGDLEQSLTQVASAQNVGDMKTLKFFLDDLLVNELSEKDMDTQRVSGLEFSKDIAAEAKDLRQIKDVKFLLENVLHDRARERPAWMRAMDQALSVVKGWFGLGGKFTAPKPLMRNGREMTKREKKLYRDAKAAEERWELMKAVRAYEKLLPQIAGAKDRVDVQLDLGYSYAKLGQYEKARSVFYGIKQRYLGSRDEDVADAMIRRVAQFEALAQQKEALLAKISAAAEPADLLDLYLELGMAQYKAFQLEAAEQSFKSAAAVNPDSPLALKALFYFAMTLKFHGKLQEAAEVFEKIIERSAKSNYAVSSKYQLAEIHRRAGDFEKAAQAFSELATQFSEEPIAPLSKFRSGYVYFYDLGDPVRAADAFQELKNSFSDTQLASYSTNEMDPYVRSTVRDFAFILIQKGLYEDARRAFEEALQQNPKDVWCYSGLATALAFLGEKQASLNLAMEALEMGADEYTIAAMGYVYEINNDYLKAIQFYEKALELKGDYPSVLYNLGRLYEFAGRFPEAVKKYEQVLSIAKSKQGHAEVYINLGHAHWFQGKFLDAAENFKKAVKLDPDSAIARYNLAAVYQVQKKDDLAKVELREVLKIDPGFKQAEKALKLLEKRR
ncbi:MAG: tetratricopeptide repeat protein [Candidatus Omnitrophica bacterium]|nr:tetratricopeptide repeat protein [Candidatus Omnitrophota bacterium]